MHAEFPQKTEQQKSLDEFLRLGLITENANRLGAARSELLQAVRSIVNPHNTELKLLYIGSGPDVANPLLATGATTLIFVDPKQLTDAIKTEITRLGGKISSESASGNRMEIYFELDGKDRKLILYQLYAEKGSVDKLPPEMKDCDVNFEKLSWGVSEPEVRERIINSIKIGGFYIGDVELDKNLGFENIPLDEKFQDIAHRFGYSPLHIYQKTMNVSSLGDRLRFNQLVSDLTWTRNGAIFGLSDDKFESSLKAYREMLTKLKGEFDKLHEGLRNEFKPLIIERLYAAPGDISKVHGSVEEVKRQFEGFKWTAGVALLPKDAKDWEDKIQKVESSPNRPTEQQLEKFIEKGREIFRNVWGSEFVNGVIQ